MDITVANSSILNPFANTFVPSTRLDSLPRKNSNKESKRKRIKVLDENQNRLKFFKTIFFSAAVLPIIKERLSKYMINYQFVNSDEDEIISTEPYISVLFTTKVSEIWKQSSGFSVCTLKPDRLLVSFFGLYSYDKAACPTMKITTRPDQCVDPVWSVKTKDVNLSSPSVVKSCGCPPMLGYHIPPEFFGNPFNLPPICKEKSIHLTQYTQVLCHFDSSGVAELKSANVPDDYVFYDDKEKTEANVNPNWSICSDLKFLARELKNIVSVVCGMLNEWEVNGYLGKVNASDLDSQLEEKTDHLGLRLMSSRLCKNLTDKEYTRKRRSLFCSEDAEILGTEANVTGSSLEDFHHNFAMQDKGEARDIPKSNRCNTPCSAWCSSPVLTAKDNCDYRRNARSLTSLRTVDNFYSLRENFRRFSEPSGTLDNNMWAYGGNWATSARMKSDMVFNRSGKALAKDYHCELQYSPMTIDEFQRRNSNGGDSGFSETLEVECPSFDGKSGEESLIMCPDSVGKIRSIWSSFDGADSLWQDMPECIPAEKQSQNWSSLRLGHVRNLRCN